MLGDNRGMKHKGQQQEEHYSLFFFYCTGTNRTIMSDQQKASHTPPCDVNPPNDNPSITDTKAGHKDNQEMATEGDKQQQITLKTSDGLGNEILFRVKRNMPLKKLISAYCKKRNIAEDTARFSVDGTRIAGYETPDDLELEDGDILHVGIMQTGG